MAAPGSAPLVQLPCVTFGGTNFQEWSTMLCVCLNSHRIWGHLTGLSPPPVPARPEEPTIGVDGVPSSAQVMEDYAHAVEQYMADLADYNAWLANEARATQIIFGSIKVEFAMDLSTLPTTKAMWEWAQALYQPSTLLSTSPL
jgi:hypothetical protein